MPCPFCGEDDQMLDLLLAENGDDLVDWTPCCEDLRDAVGESGWDAMFGETLAETLTAEVAPVDHTHTDGISDSLALHNLRGEAPGSVPGWQSKVFALVDQHHSHHGAPVGWKAGVAVYNGRKMVGVAVLGRPVARLLAQAEPHTLEVTRVCVWGHPAQRRNAASMLYGLCASEAKRLGADKLVTYTLETEDGTSCRAAGFAVVARTRGGSWSRAARVRTDDAPTCRKFRWSRGLTKQTRKAVAAEAAALGGVR